MSGGSYDYIGSKIEDFASELEAHTPLRLAFRDLLERVAKAAHDIEWVDSCDWSKGDEDAAIRACLDPGAELATVLKEAERLRDALNAALAAAEAAHAPH